MRNHLSSNFTCVKMRNPIVIRTHVPESVRGRRVAAVTATLTRRERQRAATVEEIREVARGLMREQGTTDVRFTDIAKVAAAREKRDPDDIGGRWIAAGTAYRDWARREPQQFALILGMPVPGYVAPQEGPTTDAAKDAMSQLSALFIRAAELGVLKEPLVREVSDEMAACAVDKHPELGDLVPPESFQAMIQTWATLHGITCLDAYGQFDWMTDEAREALFVSTLKTAALAAGIPID